MNTSTLNRSVLAVVIGTVLAAGAVAPAHAQAWRHEFAADAYGYRAIHRLGYRMDTVYALMLRAPSPQDTATHPGTRRRVAQLRELDLQFEHSTLQAARDGEAAED